MGCDGGTIPRRDELVRVKKKAEVKDKESELNFQWKCCAVTQQLLEEPIVTCHLGKLYNKLALIEALLHKDALPECARHIKNLKDVVQLKLTKNPAYTEEKSNDSSKIAQYICPIIGLEMSGKFRFVALWGCGCVFSERALKEIPTKVCHKCQKPFQEADIVILNPNEEDLVMMRQNMEMRQTLRKNKEKKNRSKLINGTVVKDCGSQKSAITNGGIEIDTGKKDIAKAGTSITDTPLEKNKTPASSSTTVLKKRSGAALEIDERAKKMKADYSLAKDPYVSDVYKSIFTSHKSEKEQTRAHWVTYNPFYN